ncbi:MAG TPA: hypothetical protein VE890_02430 [Thermoguttaceae bacterium]|nr:hypothetical protein [Thermoguttaceae bacterium]
MSYWYESLDEVDPSITFDPLAVQRSAPVEDEEAAMVEALCLQATPGPLVVDDETDGEGAVVVSLPDGRLIVSMTAPVAQTHDEAVTLANAQLICKARHLLLRLLRDRQDWKEQQEFLQERIRTLETALQSRHTTGRPAANGPKPHSPTVR